MLRGSRQPGVTLAGTSPAPAFPAAAGGTASLRAKPAVSVVGVSRRRQREVESDAMWTRKKPFLASARLRGCWLGEGTSSARLPKTIQFLIKLRSSGRTGVRCRRRGDRSHGVLRLSDRTVCLCVCVFFSVGPGGADGEPQRGGLPGGRRHHPVSAHIQRHQPGATPRHHTDVCGESDRAEGENI